MSLSSPARILTNHKEHFTRGKATYETGLYDEFHTIQCNRTCCAMTTRKESRIAQQRILLEGTVFE
jgi:hypothetical protein